LPTGRWRRHEPWISTIGDLDTGRVLGVLDGRSNTGVGAWLAARTPASGDRIEVVATDPSAAFAKAIRTYLPTAAISVHAFHLVKLANDTLTAVRQRLSRHNNGRRGRTADPSWANRRLLLRGEHFLTRLAGPPASNVRRRRPRRATAAAWGVKEQVHRLLACTTSLTPTRRRCAWATTCRSRTWPRPTGYGTPCAVGGSPSKSAHHRRHQRQDRSREHRHHKH